MELEEIELSNTGLAWRRRHDIPKADRVGIFMGD